MAEGQDLYQTPISDVAAVRAVLIAAARRRQAMSYADVLDALGHAFSRPKMRALCRTLDAIDTAGQEAGEPELAVLVVRQADRLPGQGWWVGRARDLDYDGPWTGPAAAKLVRSLQKRTFDYWDKTRTTRGQSGPATSTAATSRTGRKRPR